jgi:hypothetical protein
MPSKRTALPLVQLVEWSGAVFAERAGGAERSVCSRTEKYKRSRFNASRAMAKKHR